MGGLKWLIARLLTPTFLAFVPPIVSTPVAIAQTAQIVGLGATTCERFSQDIRSNPQLQRDYLSWAQGFMSGILLGRPLGVDTGLNLDPPSFGILRQLLFLTNFCQQNPRSDFSDGVAALYKQLRQEQKV